MLRTPARAIRPFARRRRITTSAQSAKLETDEEWQIFQHNRRASRLLLEHFEQFGSLQARENTFQPHHTLHRPPAPNQTSMSSLIAAGAHLGHSTSLMNPNFAPYAYGSRAGVTIIDMDQTLPLLRRAANLLRSVTARGGTVVFIGTRPDLRDSVRKAAERVGSQGYHVGERWIPGTLTNKVQFFGLKSAEETYINPDLVVLLNPLQNLPAIRECAMSHIPTIGVIDTNADPRIVMYPIPANDESVRTAELISGVLSLAGREGSSIWYQQKQVRTERNKDRFVSKRQAVN